MKNWARPAFTVPLQRLDMLLYREILRLRASYQLSLDEFRGLYISDRQVDELILQTPALGQVDISDLTAAAARMVPPARQALAEDPRWNAVCRAYSLSGFEEDVLLLAFVAELHSKYPILFAYLNNDITRKLPSVELALNLFCEEPQDNHRKAFACQGALLDKGVLLPVAHQSDQFSLQSGFVIAPVVREFLLAHPAMEPRLTQVCQLSRSSFRDWRQWPFAAPVAEQFQMFAEVLHNSDRLPYFVVESELGAGTDELAENALAAAGFACFRVDLQPLPSDQAAASELLRGLCQAALLEHAGVVIGELPEGQEAGQNSAKSVLSLFLRLVKDSGIPCFLCASPRSRWRDLLSGTHYLAGHLDSAGVQERRSYWHHHLSVAGLAADGGDVAAVADYFHLNYGQVKAAAEDLALRLGPSGERGAPVRESLFAAARRQSHGDMGELAERVTKDYRISDLVLPDAVLVRIREIIAAIRSRRLVFEEWGLQRRMGGAGGIVSLFAGASGTGKTMTASVIANEIGLDLYRIELSGIVSKYIGETEKNLDRIFAAARRANGILFFDEADALFGKRSEVKDAHDRYANIEVAYLLQKIENHDGIVILTTNLAKSIDQAFTRRMQFIVEFPRPDVALRERLWRGMFGDSVPLADDVNINFLARQLDNTGGDIRNMVLDAALMAAASDSQVIDMALLVRAAARQMMKQGKVPSAVEFKHYFSLVDNRSA